MTVSTTANKITYDGSGSTGPFTFTFRFFNNSEIYVVKTVNEVDSTLTETTDYTLTGSGSYAGGSVTLVTALATGESITIYRTLSIQQLTDLRNQGAFYAETHEEVFDRLTMVDQQQKERIDACMRLPVSVDSSLYDLNIPVPNANKLVGWDNTGTALKNYDAAEFASVVAYGTAVADTFTGDDTTTDFTLSFDPANVNNLDVSVGGVCQVPGVDYTWTSGLVVTFTTAPPNGETVLIRYMRALPQGSIDWNSVTGRPFVAPEDFGAVGDGAADDTLPLSYMFDSIANGGTVTCRPNAIYRVTSAITKTFANGAVVTINGNGAKIDATSVSSSFLTLGGSVVSTQDLAAAVAKHDTTITTSAALSAVDGDVVLISSSDYFTPYYPAFPSGELVRVDGTATTTINLLKGLYAGYDSATTTVSLLATPHININNLTVEQNGNYTGIILQYVRVANVDGCRISGSRDTGISVRYTYSGLLQGNTISDGWYSGTGTSYNIGIYSSQNIKCIGNTLLDHRHAISCGGQEPCRDIEYIGNSCQQHPSVNDTMSLDSHANTEGILVMGNTAPSISMFGKNVKVVGNVLRSDGVANSPLTVWLVQDSDYCEIADNTVISTNGDGGVWVAPTISATSPVSSVTVGRVLITGNSVSTDSGNAFSLSPRGNMSATINDCVVTGNVFVSTADDAYAAQYASRTAGAYNITTDVVQSSGNVYHSTAFNPVYIDPDVGIGHFLSTSDVFKGNRDSSSSNALYTGGTDVTFNTPVIDGGTHAQPHKLTFSNSGTTRLFDATLINIAGGIVLNCADYCERGTVFDADSTTSVTNTSNARIITGYTLNGMTEGYGEFIPQSGVFVKGSHQYNSLPAANIPKGWICTTGGGSPTFPQMETRQNSTAYSTVGMGILWSNGTAVLKLKIAGTTAASPPDLTGKVYGNDVVDGTATWTYILSSFYTTVTVRPDSTAISSAVWRRWPGSRSIWEATTYPGTTASAPPSISGKSVLDTVVDGTVTWTMRMQPSETPDVRANSTAYPLNHWVQWSTGTTVWQCTTAGTSTGAAPSIVGKVVGDTVTDGTAVWTLRSLTTAVWTSEGDL